VRFLRAVTGVTVAALAGGLAFAGCTGSGFSSAACRTVDKAVEGDLASDVVGTWEGYGIDSRLVYLFEEGGEFRFVEPPNRYAPSGLEDEGSWIVLGEDELSVSWSDGSSSSWTAEVTDANLRLTTSSAFGENEESWTETWSRVCCTGSPKPCL